jgi:hypothetical protein
MDRNQEIQALWISFQAQFPQWNTLTNAEKKEKCNTAFRTLYAKAEWDACLSPVETLTLEVLQLAMARLSVAKEGEAISFLKAPQVAGAFLTSQEKGMTRYTDSGLLAETSF